MAIFLKWLTSPVCYVLAIILLFVGIIAYKGYDEHRPWHKRDVQFGCELAGLAYPTGTILRSYHGDGIFAQNVWFSFTDTRPHIEAWIKQCERLKNRHATHYTMKHQLIFMDDDKYYELKEKAFEGKSNGKDPYEGHQVKFINCEWFAPHISNGVDYEIPMDGDQDGGFVCIDWDTNTVWVYAHHS